MRPLRPAATGGVGTVYRSLFQLSETLKLTNSMNEIDLSDFVLTTEELEALQAAWEAKLLKIKHPYVFDLIAVLAPYPRPQRRTYVLTLLRSNRTRAGLPIPRTFDDAAQRALEYYCLDSDVFKERQVSESEALFCWPKGKGVGVWGLIRENARRWVLANRAAIPHKILK
jgi:hypothetical protein